MAAAVLGNASISGKGKSVMLTQAQAQRYATESGLCDIMIAEKEAILTFLLQLLSERGLLNRMAFKGGTCLRKIFIGSQGRFSTDLDFTGTEEHNHEDVILEMMAAFEQPYHGIQFSIPDNAYYETEDTLSWGVNPIYAHDWNPNGDSEVKLQISRRETPTLPTELLPQQEQSYFRYLPFRPISIRCLAFEEIIAEKIRAGYQRNKARDIYDLSMFASKPFDRVLIRRLVILKLWQARDSFDPQALLTKLEDGRDFDWHDLGQLVRRNQTVDPSLIITDCIRGYRFLGELSPEEQKLASDPYQRERGLWEQLRNECRAMPSATRQ
jgi:predicted nucleotidyltransferase component of viral defense system